MRFAFAIPSDQLCNHTHYAGSKEHCLRPAIVFVKPGLPMQHKLLHETNGQRTFAVVLQTGEEVMASLQNFVVGQNISAAQFSAIGAFSDLVLMYFDWEEKNYICACG